MKSIAIALGALFSLVCAALLVLAWAVIALFALMGGGIVVGVAAFSAKMDEFNQWLDREE